MITPDAARYLQPDKPSKLMALALMLSAHTASVTLPEYAGKSGRPADTAPGKKVA